MSENETQKPVSGGFNRRSVVKGAAWSMPVIAAAIAAPAASASVANASLAWNGTRSSLLGLQVIDSQDVVTVGVLFTIPNQFTLQNGAGAISGPAVVTVVVGRPAGINLTTGTARGFGVYSYDGVPTPSSTRTAVYQRGGVLNTPYGFPLTTYTSTHSFTVASNGALTVPVEFGLTGSSGLLNIAALASFPVTLTVDFGNGNVYSDTTTISVPVGAGIL